MSGQQIVGRCSVCFSIAGLTDDGSLIPHTNGRTKMPCTGHYPLSMVERSAPSRTLIGWLLLLIFLGSVAFFLGMGFASAFVCLP